MIRAVMEGSGMAIFAVAGLVIFVGTFVALVIWVLTRRQKQVDRWSSIPLQDQPVEPRRPLGDTTTDDTTTDDTTPDDATTGDAKQEPRP